MLHCNVQVTGAIFLSVSLLLARFIGLWRSVTGQDLAQYGTVCVRKELYIV